VAVVATATSEVEVPSWLIGAWYGLLTAAGIAAGVGVGRARSR
jgi:hypothetical protein